jgi:chorismate synthase
MSQLGDIVVPFQDWRTCRTILRRQRRCPTDRRMEAAMDALRKDGDSIGARIDVMAQNIPSAWASRSTTSSMPTSPTP